MRIQFYIYWLIVLAPYAGNAQEKPIIKPNVLMIYCDDLSASINAYKTDGAITPNLDDLAKKGRVFLNA